MGRGGHSALALKAGEAMTDEEKKEYREKLIADFKTYNHIDYDDDTEIIELLLDTVFEELGDLIPDFDPYTMKSRQRLLTLVFLKELYDNREKYQKDSKGVSNAVASMLLKEAGMRNQIDEMFRRCEASGSYGKALGIIGEYVDMDLPEPSIEPQKSQKKKARSAYER